MQETKGTEINEIKKPEPENFKKISCKKQLFFTAYLAGIVGLEPTQ